MRRSDGGEDSWIREPKPRRRRLIRRKRSDLPTWTQEDMAKAMEDPEYAEEMRQFIADWDCVAGDGLEDYPYEE